MLNYAAAAGLTALAVYLLIVAVNILLPFVIAVFIWYFVNAIAAASRRIRIGGWPLPLGVRVGAASVILLVLLWMTVILVTTNVEQVAASASLYERNLQRLTSEVGSWLGRETQLTLETLFTGMNLSRVTRNVARALSTLAGSAATIAIYVVFLLLEQHSFSKKIAALFPDPQGEARVHRLLGHIGGEVQTYVWLKTLTSLLTGAASYLVMRIIGVDYAAFWALTIFGLNYIPYIGAWVGVIFPTALALVQFESFGPVVATCVLLTMVQFGTGSILEPRLMGKGLNLSPVVMLLALALWGTIWGVAGMFLAVPMMVVIMIVCSHFETTRPFAILLSEEGTLRH